jgi:hypothetical protein
LSRVSRIALTNAEDFPLFPVLPGYVAANRLRHSAQPESVVTLSTELFLKGA